MNVPTVFLDALIDGDKCWFVHAYYPALFSADYKSGMCKLEAVLPNNHDFGECLFASIAQYGDKLVLAPRSSDVIAIFNCVTKKVETVSLDISKMKGAGVFNLFTSTCVFGEYVYLFSGRYPAIVRLDMRNYSIEYFEDWLPEINDISPNRELVYFRKAVLSENRAYLPCWQAAAYLIFNFENCSYEVVYTGDKGSMSSIAVTGTGKLIYAYKDSCKISGEVECEIDKYCGVDSIFWKDKYLYIVPRDSADLLLYNMETEEILVFDRIDNEIEKIPEGYLKYDRFVMAAIERNGLILITSNYDGKVRIIYEDEQEERVLKFCVTKEDKLAVEKSRYKNVCKENKDHLLKTFIEDIVRMGD